jgi:hypothetical protein
VDLSNRCHLDWIGLKLAMATHVSVFARTLVHGLAARTLGCDIEKQLLLVRLCDAYHSLNRTTVVAQDNTMRLTMKNYLCHAWRMSRGIFFQRYPGIDISSVRASDSRKADAHALAAAFSGSVSV